MERYNVTGMSCAACVSRVEKAVKDVSGVDSVSVNLLTNSMKVTGNAEKEAVIKAVEKAGYGITEKNRNSSAGEKRNEKEASVDETSREEVVRLKKRLIKSVSVLCVLMYFSMGHSMANLPLPGFFRGNPVAIGLVQMFLSLIIITVNRKFFKTGLKGMTDRAPNMDTLVAMGSGISFAWSVYVLFMMTKAQTDGMPEKAASYMNQLYFESAAMILTLITVGKLLEAVSKGRTTDALKNLISLTPKTATLIRGGQEITVDVRDVKKSDIFVVKPGESFPVDGIVTHGESSVDESSLTGESVPVDKSPGESVFAGTVNQHGFIKCTATGVGEETSLAQIIQMVSEAVEGKAPIAKIADRVSGFFVPIVIILAIITIFAWLIIGYGAGFALARGISVLVISCPCALGLATPVAIMVGSGVGAKNGILFKQAEILELAGKVNCVILDKTGTITMGQPEVTEIKSADGVEDYELVKVAYSLERKSEHPFSKAVVKYSEGVKYEEVTRFEAYPGNGLVAVMGVEVVCGGKLEFLIEKVLIPNTDSSEADKLAGEGKTVLFFSKGERYLGYIAVADTIKKDSPEAVKRLRNMGMEVLMLSGDSQKTSEAIASQVGVGAVIGGVFPGDKGSIIERLKKKGKVAMVGDGINDAPALTGADVGMAIGTGTDVALDAADVVLMRNSLLDVSRAIAISRKTLLNIKENLFWAFIYNIIGIPLAAGVWIPFTGWEMNPMFCAAAMSLSSFCVIMNSLRLNLFNPENSSTHRKSIGTEDIKLEIEMIKNERKREVKKMRKTMKIEGMMCSHCENAVKNALESLAGVVHADVNRENDTAILDLDKEVTDDVLKKAVEDKGYKVIAVK